MLLIFSYAIAIPRAYPSTWYPDDGDMLYDGENYIDSYFTWSDPGSWSHDHVGYEHDLAVQGGYFTDCSAWTNLPFGYSDCPTADVLDPEEKTVWSFGTFHAPVVDAGKQYYGAWSFNRGPSLTADFTLNSQEVEPRNVFLCEDIIHHTKWCMEGTGPDKYRLLLDGYLNTGGWRYWTW
jgi:hypothetical protein